MYYERSLGGQVLNLAGLIFSLFFIGVVFEFIGISWMDVPDVIRGHLNEIGQVTGRMGFRF